MAARTPAMDPPEEREVSAAVGALPEIQAFLRRHPRVSVVTVRVSDDGTERTLTVPRAAVDLLAEILRNMAQGQSVSVVPGKAELTTQQAADLLNVSRPFLIGLLTSGEIGYRMVGTHRRIRAEDLLAYKRSDDSRRRRSADELTGLSQDLDLY